MFYLSFVISYLSDFNAILKMDDQQDNKTQYICDKKSNNTPSPNIAHFIDTIQLSKLSKMLNKSIRNDDFNKIHNIDGFSTPPPPM